MTNIKKIVADERNYFFQRWSPRFITLIHLHAYGNGKISIRVCLSVSRFVLLARMHRHMKSDDVLSLSFSRWLTLRTFLVPYANKFLADCLIQRGENRAAVSFCNVKNRQFFGVEQKIDFSAIQLYNI